MANQQEIQIQDSYLRQIAQVAGRPEEEFVAPSVRASRIADVTRAFGAYEQSGLDYFAFVRRWDEAVTAGRDFTETMPQMDSEDATLLNQFIPGRKEISQVPPEYPADEVVEKSREVQARNQAFALAAAGLLNTEARTAHEPGQHAPALLRYLPIWYEAYKEEYTDRAATKHLMVGAMSVRSAESLQTVVKRFDPQAELTAIDLVAPASALPGEGRRGVKFETGNAFNIVGQFPRGSYDMVHAHRLVFNDAQLAIEPPHFREDKGDIGNSYVTKEQRDEAATIVYTQMYEALHDGGVVADVEPIDWRDEDAVARIKRLLVNAGFKDENIFICPADEFATRRLTDEFLAGNESLPAFTRREQRARNINNPVVVAEEGASLILAVKEEPQQQPSLLANLGRRIGTFREQLRQAVKTAANN